MTNMSKMQRVIMIVIGGVIVGWGFSAQNWWGAIGLLPLVSGFTGFCLMTTLTKGKCCPFTPKKSEQESSCCSGKDKPKAGGCCGK
jgi:hypothetical protein